MYKRVLKYSWSGHLPKLPWQNNRFFFWKVFYVEPRTFQYPPHICFREMWIKWKLRVPGRDLKIFTESIMNCKRKSTLIIKAVRIINNHRFLYDLVSYKRMFVCYFIFYLLEYIHHINNITNILSVFFLF